MKRLFAPKTKNMKNKDLKSKAEECKKLETTMKKMSDDFKKIKNLILKAQKCKDEKQEITIKDSIDKGISDYKDISDIMIIPLTNFVNRVKNALEIKK